MSVDIAQMILVVVLAGALAPLLAHIFPIENMPIVVVEIALGVLFGPMLLGFIAHPHDLHLLKELGVIFLFFLAGFEVDINGVRGGPLRRAIRTWGISLAIAVPIGYAMAAGDLITHPGIVALAFVTTALGPLVPIMQDRRQMTTPFGSHVMAIGAIGEFGPVLLAAFLLNGDQATWLTGLLLLAFSAVCVVALNSLIRSTNKGVENLLLRLALDTLHSSAQFAVRLSMVGLAGLVYLTAQWGLDPLLGAFAGGFIIGQVGTVTSQDETRATIYALQSKIEAIGFGIFIPIFFVLTGAELALDVFIESPRAWITVPLAVIGSLVIRGTPIYLLYSGIDLLTKRRLALVAATQLPLVAALMSRFTARGWVPTDIATGIIVGAVITVAVFPLMALHDIDNNDPNGQLLQTKSS